MHGAKIRRERHKIQGTGCKMPGTGIFTTIKLSKFRKQKGKIFFRFKKS
jgi:hypothetical protein